ncbi:DUF1569 domain-containing protein [bacterium]|nr:DUF1569 domain-containing protein [bacterium]
MSATATHKVRRTVRYATLDEFKQDLEGLIEGGYETVGDWTLAQICDHLGSTFHGSIDGVPFKAPWFARTFIAPFLKNSVLIKPMKPGIQLGKEAQKYLPKPDVTLEAALEKVRSGLSRLEHEVPVADHPFFGKMASEEWMQLHLRHCELHMSFVLPKE